MSGDVSSADALEAAADYIRTHGHHKGQFCSPTGDARCVLGALAMVGGEWHSESPAAEALKRHVGLCRGPLGRIADWNDEAGRTDDEVIDALMETAARLRRVENARRRHRASAGAKEVARRYARKWRAQNLKHRREYKRKWNAMNRERYREIQKRADRRYVANNRDAIRKRQLQHMRLPDVRILLSVKARERYASNPDYYAARRRAQYAANPEKYRAYQRAYKRRSRAKLTAADLSNIARIAKKGVRK